MHDVQNVQIGAISKTAEGTGAAVAYIVVEGELYLSNGLNVNFFDLGTEEPTKN